ncbi:MAG: Dabb family protein [Bacteroidota bacterium]
MHKITLFLSSLVCLAAFACTQPKAQVAETTEAAATVTESSETMAQRNLRHVVLFKFKDDAPEAEVDKLHAAFNALPAAIPEIVDFEWGINDSPENFHQDFTHCYLVTFASTEDRDSVYTPHPQHQAFVQSLQPWLEKVFVVDYWAYAPEEVQ